MKGWFDNATAKSKERERKIDELLKIVEQQKADIAAIKATIQASEIMDLSPSNLGIPFASIADITSALTNKDQVKKLREFAATIKKNKKFASKLHKALLTKDLMKRSFVSDRK